MTSDALAATHVEESGQEAPVIKPMPLRLAVLFFGIPTVLYALNYHLVALPSLKRDSLALSAVALIVPYVVLLAASLVAYRMEGRALSWAALKDRFRFRKVTWHTWLLAAVLLLLSLVALWLFVPFRQHVLHLNAPDMGYAVSSVSGNGNWLIASGVLAQVLINVIGEEAWWRGYILPRQELAHGRYAWLVHGTMWTLFHVYQWWDLVALLPICLSIAYVSQRSKSIWPALAMHFGFNSIDLGLLVVSLF
jgi:membrane protease YdiL (CAAX protease family)